jgi:hypothetical protein
MKLSKGRKGRRERRRQIIVRLGEIVDSLCIHARIIYTEQGTPTQDASLDALASLSSEHRSLTYELTELATIDDQAIIKHI